MGNYFNRCYVEENNEQPDNINQQQPSIVNNINQRQRSIVDQEILGIQQNDQNKVKQFQYSKIDNIIQIQTMWPIQQENSFQDKIIETVTDFLFENSQNLDLNKNSIKMLFNEPFLRISSDDIQQFASNQFQIQIAMQRYSLGEKYLGNLNKTELLIAEVIKANVTIGLAPLLIQEKTVKFENKKLEKLFQGIKIIFLVCTLFQGILKHYLKDGLYRDNIKIYNIIYYQFQKLILNINYENEEIYNALPDFNNDCQFSLLGYAMRFWCQIVIANIVDKQPNNISILLLNSFRNVEKKGMEIEIYSYIVGAIDLCSNEYTSNWIGHQKNFNFEKKLIDMNHNELNQINSPGIIDFKDFSDKINNQLQIFRQFYPTWIFEKKYLHYSLDLKIKQLMLEIKSNNNFENDSQLSPVIQSYDEIPTGYGLFDEKENEDDMESKMKIMAKFLFIDQNVKPSSIYIFSKEPYYSFQPANQQHQEYISKSLSQLIKPPNKPVYEKVNEKVKSINPKYFEYLKINRLQYKQVLKDIKIRNAILENRNRKKQIDQLLLKDKQQQLIKGYNFFYPQQITNKEMIKYVEQFGSQGMGIFNSQKDMYFERLYNILFQEFEK